MKTKEAIDYVESKRYVMGHCGNNKLADEVIELLQRGEKHEATIIEIAKIADKEIYPYANDGERLKYILEEIETMNKGGKQKYFPKPAKKTITIEIEGDDNINLGLATVIMKHALDSWEFKKGIKFKVKEGILK